MIQISMDSSLVQFLQVILHRLPSVLVQVLGEDVQVEAVLRHAHAVEGGAGAGGPGVGGGEEKCIDKIRFPLRKV